MYGFSSTMRPRAIMIEQTVAERYNSLEEKLLQGEISAAKYALEIELVDEWARQQYQRAI